VGAEPAPGLNGPGETLTIYRKVIDRNYMSHRQIAEALGGCWLQDSPGRILDLGCGDMEVTSALMRKAPPSIVVAVDGSSSALEEARKRVEAVSTDGRFVNSDLLAFLRGNEGEFDWIIAGFTIHHLTAEEKVEFFALARRHLLSGGSLVLFDCVRPVGMSRDEAVTSYLDWIESDWTAMTDRENELIREHIEESDYPEEPGTLRAMAEEAGFAGWDLLGSWNEDRHVLFRFTGVA